MVAVYKTVGHQQPGPLVGADAVPSMRLRTVAGQRTWAPRPWTGSWTGAPDNPSVVTAVSAMIRVIYVVRGGRRVRKDTKTHQDRWLAIDPVTCALIVSYLAEIKAELAAVGVELRDDAYLFSNDPAHARPWNPDWVTHRVADAADAAGVELDIKGGRHYTASQLLAGGFDLRNTAARLGHSGGATTLRHYANSRSPRSTGAPPPTSRS